MPIVLTDRAARDAAYRAGYCIDCGAEEYSAGRPRCAPCHTAHQTRIAAGGNT